MSFKPTAKRIVVPYGGRIDSDKLSLFIQSVVSDLISMGEESSEVRSEITAQAIALQAAFRDLRQRIDQLSGEIEATRKFRSADSLELDYHINLHDSNKFTFLSSSDFSTRAMVDTLFGEATVPINAAEPRFFQISVRTGSVITIEDLSIVVTGTFDAGDGDGVVNHESGGTITEGEPLNAFNGSNTSRWMRKVSYPLYNDTTEVLCEITVDIPEGSGGESNVIYINPFPSGDVDILGVYTSPDLGNSFTLIPGFSQVDGAGPKRWIIPVQNVQRLKIRLRQRNWYEEDGRKVFYYGAQEIGMFLMEWDKTYSSSNPLNLNHTVVLKQTAPTGYLFNKLTSLTTDPLFTLEDSGLRHIHIKACSDEDGTDVIWDSDSDSLPQDTAGFTIGTPVSTIYFMVTLNYVASSGGTTSPFFVGTSPTFKSLDFQANVEAE